MKIAYCSLLLPEEKHLAERAKKRLSGISLHKFTRALISGLDSNLSEPVTIFNIINTLNYPNFPQLIFRNEQWHHTKQSKDYHIGYINLFGIKYITQERNLYKHLKRWVLSNRTEDCMICVHHIQEDVYYLTISQIEMPIVEDVLRYVDGKHHYMIQK